MRKYPVYAPVIIPTLCRYEHFKRCIESLKKCTGAEYTDVYIGLDYPTKDEHWDGYRKICDYVTKITGFNRLIVLKRDKNYGVTNNISDLKEQVKRLSDRVILSEDDNEFSPCFLDYMNSCLEKYKNEPKVFRICGCLMPWDVNSDAFIGDFSFNAFPAKDFNASGVGIWFWKEFSNPLTKKSILDSYYLTAKTLKYGYWQAITRFLHQLHKDSQLPDVCLRLHCAFNNKYCIFPKVSKVKNWGYDGSGLHSDNNLHWLDVVTLDTSSTFELDHFELRDYREIRLFVKELYGIRGWKRRVSVIKCYIFYRLTGMRTEDIPEGKHMRDFLFKKLKLNV